MDSVAGTVLIQQRLSVKCDNFSNARNSTGVDSARNHYQSRAFHPGRSREASPMKTIVKTILILLFTIPTFVQHVFAQQENPAFSQAELDQMLAPIALYPDVLLSQILVASTYPLEVVEAARWSQANPHLEGEQAVAAVDDQTWDPSVKALVAFPQVLMRMNDDLNWMRALGDAFLFQEAQVMDTVQGLRQRAHEAGHLNSNDNARVIRENRVIVIEPADPQIVYVPYYNPRVVYGSWWWPNYAPVYWGPPPGIHLSLGFNWGRGVFVTPGFFFSSFDWHRRHTVVVHRHTVYRHKPHFESGRHTRYTGYPRWQHNAYHRRGVAYRHTPLQRQFGTSRTHGDAARDRNFGNRNNTPHRPPNKSRSSGGWHDYATAQERRRNEARTNTQNSRPQYNRTDAERAETRDRWRQAREADFGSRSPGSDRQDPTSRDNRRSDSNHGPRNPEQNRDRSRRTDAGAVPGRPETGNRQRPTPNRPAPQNMEPRRQTGNVGANQNRRTYDGGARTPAESHPRQGNRVNETSRPPRNDRRQSPPSPSATPYRTRSGGASVAPGRRTDDGAGSSRQNTHREGSANRPSGRSDNRARPSRSR